MATDRERETRVVRSARSTAVAAVSAGALSIAIVVLQYVANHEYPFGAKNRNYDDYFAQFVPFYAMFRDLLHGHPAIDAQFNWFVGLGQPFLPDYAVYLGGPWTFLIALFPTTAVEVGIFVVTLAKVAVVAASMVVYLRIAHGAGNAWLAALLGTAYATSGFVLEEGLFDPMWLEGVAALPLLALVGHWCRSGRHLVPSVLLVGLLYWSNFYSAVLATVGAVYLTLVMDVVDRVPWRTAAAQFGRFAVRGALGVGLSLPVVLPGVLAGAQAPPLDLTFGPRDVALSRYLGRLFPLTELLDYSPGLTVGTVLLVGASAFFATRRIPARERVVFGAALLLMITTMAWSGTRGVWYGFVQPHGSYFRNAFVVSGLLLVIVWRFLLRPPQWTAVLTGGTAVLVLLAGLTVVNRRGRHHELSTAVVVIMVLITVAGVATMTLRPATRRAIGALLMVALVAELAVNAIVVEQLRSAVRRPMGAWYADAGRDLALVAQAQQSGGGWPPYRVDAAMYWYGDQSALLGVPGVRYYSSTFSERSVRTFTDLGVPSTAKGCEMRSVEDLPIYQLLSVSARLDHDGADGASRLTTYDSLPLVRVARPARPAPPGLAPVFSRRDSLWDEQVYTPPVWTVRPATDTVVPGAAVRLSGSCPAGGLLQADIRPDEGTLTVRPAGTGVAGPVVEQGTPAAGAVPAPMNLPVSAGGTFDLDASAQGAPQRLDPGRFACYDVVRAHALVTRTRGQAPDLTVRGNHLKATWARPVTGEVIVSTTALGGWSCAVDSRPARIVPRQGLLAVPVNGAARLSCRYRTPGLGLGIGLAGASMALLIALDWSRRSAVRGPAHRDGRPATGDRRLRRVRIESWSAVTDPPEAQREGTR